MKIQLSRFRNEAQIIGTSRYEDDNGNPHVKTAVKMKFIYANVNQSINNQLNSLDSDSSSRKLIATLDPRIEKYKTNTNGDLIEINNVNYKISSVSVDDSRLIKFYTITLVKNEVDNE